jgi:hypothetical protein
MDYRPEDLRSQRTGEEKIIAPRHAGRGLHHFYLSSTRAACSGVIRAGEAIACFLIR